MKYFFTLILFVATTVSYAQHTNFNTQRNWSLNKKEILFGFGATQFLGDLGGKDQIGTDYSPIDIDWPSTSIGGMIGYRYRFHPFWATTTSLNIGMIKGDDAQTQDIVRNNRNLHFKSLIVELSQRIEFIVAANEKFGSRYSLRGHGRRMKNKNGQIYLLTGIGVVYYNPKALYNGSWTALRPLKTEGQGLPGGADKYGPVTLTFPFGIGMRTGLSQMWRVGIEVTYVKTFSDYIDDVHGVYYDPNELAAQVGSASAALSNPQLASTPSNWFGTGLQRGDKQKDAYFYGNIVFYRNMTYRGYAKQRRQNKWRGRYKF